MNLGLHGKCALVTAASSGLGFATVNALASEGVSVVLCSRDAAHAQAAAERARQETGARVLSYAADVSKDSDLQRLVGDAAAELDGLDILVCNAGGPPPGSFLNLSEKQWDTAYGLTLQSVVRSIRHALPHLRARGGGRILVIVSSSVKRPLPNLLLSNVFRPAVQGLCKSLSLELASENIQVNCLAPGRIETERVAALDQALAERQKSSFAEVRAKSIAGIPMGRLGVPEEFGRVAAFLCSEAAIYMTGSTVLVDGGAVSCL
jgi:3-oxoacyl-[acyl-carrier protein] reductase